jgi:pyridoxamine 5'-phosphate oxidase
VGAEHDQTLELESLPSDPVVLVRHWVEDAERAGVRLPNAAALATASADGRPSIRHVLLRGYEDGAFLFYTNRNSRKGAELAANARAAFSLYWRELDRQISVTGAVSVVPDETSDAYFATRPREARIGAWASEQSTELRSREELMARFERFDAAYPGEDVPRPPHWGGYRVEPSTIEFWRGRPHRLHDRFLFERSTDGWTRRRLAP